MHFALPHSLAPSSLLRTDVRPASAARFGGWILKVARDPFTGARTCTLRAHRMAFDKGAVGFGFSPRLDTFEAVYRVDSGPPHAWRANVMTLAAHGVVFQTDDLPNPSGGLVILPISALRDAREVWIRPSPRSRPTAFRLQHLASALEVAQRRGCSPEFLGVEAP